MITTSTITSILTELGTAQPQLVSHYYQLPILLLPLLTSCFLPCSASYPSFPSSRLPSLPFPSQVHLICSSVIQSSHTHSCLFTSRTLHPLLPFLSSSSSPNPSYFPLYTGVTRYSKPAAMKIAAGSNEDSCRQLSSLLPAAMKIAAGSHEDCCRQL